MDNVTKINQTLDHYGQDIAAAYLFGSQASGCATGSSDLDIAVLLSPAACHKAAKLRFRLYADLSHALQRNDIDLVIMNTARNSMLLEEIVRKGQRIFDRITEFRLEFECRILHEGIDFRHQRKMVMGL